MRRGFRMREVREIKEQKPKDFDIIEQLDRYQSLEQLEAENEIIFQQLMGDYDC